jgi:hypothetical protein
MQYFSQATSCICGIEGEQNNALRTVLFWVIMQQLVAISCNFLQEITTAEEFSSRPLHGRSLKSHKATFCEQSPSS